MNERKLERCSRIDAAEEGTLERSDARPAVLAASRSQISPELPSTCLTRRASAALSPGSGPRSFTVLLAYSIAKPYGTAAWQRPHPYVGSHWPTAPRQYGGWNPGAAPSDPHCARASPIEQKSVPGPQVG
jgi:hypothetical protein